VSGGSSPTGTVTFSQSAAGKVTLPSPPTCTLSPSRSCSVTVTGASPGGFALTASYGGDSSNTGSQGSTTLTVFQNEVTTTITYPSFPPLCPTSNPTGVSVTILNSTAKPGTVVTIYITKLGDLGSGTSELVSIVYYEIQIVGVTNGVASVCINSTQVNATTQMKFYYGGWYYATNIVLIKGAAILGDIPVLALNSQTLVVIGTPIDTPHTIITSIIHHMLHQPFGRLQIRLLLPY
jgi:hypothetical protein